MNRENRNDNTYAEDIAFFGALSEELLRGCMLETTTGIRIYTPDGKMSYGALWLRDFAYMTEYGGEWISSGDIRDCVDYAIAHRREEDGWLPDRVYPDGLTAYAAGTNAAPVGLANLDNDPFLIMTVYRLFLRKKPWFDGCFARWKEALEQGLRILPVNPDGLICNDPAKPHSPYGFTDTVGKTGELFLESVFVWRALGELREMIAATGETPDPALAAWQEKIECHIDALFDARCGMYLAATEDCRQVDIWGSAYALAVNFPPAERHRREITQWLLANRNRYLYRGQVRHLPEGEYWQRLLIGVPQDTYQNGAYWGTASGWVWTCFGMAAEGAAGEDLRTEGRKAADELLSDLRQDMEQYGSCECITRNGERKLGTFVVSAVNMYGALRNFAKEMAIGRVG